MKFLIKSMDEGCFTRYNLYRVTINSQLERIDTWCGIPDKNIEQVINNLKDSAKRFADECVIEEFEL